MVREQLTEADYFCVSERACEDLCEADGGRLGEGLAHLLGHVGRRRKHLPNRPTPTLDHQYHVGQFDQFDWPRHLREVTANHGRLLRVRDQSRRPRPQAVIGHQNESRFVTGPVTYTLATCVCVCV